MCWINEEGTALAIDSAGNLFVTGRAGYSTYSEIHSDFVTIKYDGVTGQQLENRRYNGPHNLIDDAKALAVGSGDNIYITGSSTAATSGRDYVTIKYNGVTGQQLENRRYNGPHNLIDDAKALAVDSAGNAFVTGSSFSLVGPDPLRANIVTIKY